LSGVIRDPDTHNYDTQCLDSFSGVTITEEYGLMHKVNENGVMVHGWGSTNAYDII